MLNFTNFTRLDNIFKFNTFKKSVVSESAFSRICGSYKNVSLIFKKKKKDYVQILNTIKENQRCYPVVCMCNNRIVSGILITENVNESNDVFKNRLNEIYELSPESILVLYKQGVSSKILFENAMVELEKSHLIEDFNQHISKVIGKDFKILGIEVPTEKELITEYRKNNYIVFALNEDEFNNSVSWKDII